MSDVMSNVTAWEAKKNNAPLHIQESVKSIDKNIGNILTVLEQINENLNQLVNQKSNG